MTKICAVFCGGDPVSSLTVRRDRDAFDCVIAADSGYRLAERLSVKPDLVIGDFDSAPRPENAPTKTFPVEKDDTDLMLALKDGLALGCDGFLIYGATGGRLDHTIAAVQSLAFLLDNRAHGKILSDTEMIELLLPGSYSFEPVDGFSLSLFAYSAEVSGLTIEGAKYCCDNITLSRAFPLGVSNCVPEGEATVSFSHGLLLAVRSKL